MFIKATYNNEECLLNTDYIVDIFNADKWVADVYVLDVDRDAYKVKQSEIQKLLNDNYTPQTDCEDIYPLVIIKDRYTGVYSNGKYTAWNMYFEDIPREIDEDDVTCHNFWHSYDGIVGLGETPNDAIQDLRKKLNSERNEK